MWAKDWLGLKDGFPIFISRNWVGGAAVYQDMGDYRRNIFAEHLEVV